MTRTTAGETWLDLEELAYNVPLRQSPRKACVRITANPFSPDIPLPCGELRRVTVGVPDTSFTIPAILRYRGKRVRGFVTVLYGTEEYSFIPDNRGNV